jgi:carbon-monoxide dehydrogenase small subunit
MQAAFRDCHGLQCGFCTPGMIMQAIDLVTDAQSQSKPLDSDAIRHGLEGNICRCTGYQNIVACRGQGRGRNYRRKRRGPSRCIPSITTDPTV